MKLADLREWLIANGVPAEELDNVVESPVIRDIGHGLLLSLQNDDDIGQMLVMMLMQADAQNERIAQLEARLAALEGGV